MKPGHIGTLANAIRTYGKTAQKMMLFEEMSELQKEVCKEMRGKNNREEIAEEIADVKVMLMQLMMMYDLDPSHIEKIVEMKIERLERRLKENGNDQ